MNDPELIAWYMTWVVKLTYFAAIIPQILMNYRLRSTENLSDIWLFGYFNGYMAAMYYVFCRNLPLAYKVITPICLLAVLIMFYQRFSYHPGVPSRRMKYVLAANGIMWLAFLPIAFFIPVWWGTVIGWVEAGLWGTYQIPLALKMFRAKSVQGISFMFVSVLALGTLMEFSSGIVLGLPLSTLCNNVRSFVLYLGYCGMFWTYRGR